MTKFTVLSEIDDSHMGLKLPSPGMLSEEAYAFWSFLGWSPGGIFDTSVIKELQDAGFLNEIKDEALANNHTDG